MRRSFGVHALGVLALLTAVLWSCSTENVTQPVSSNPGFLVSPDTLPIVDTSPSGAVYLSTDAPGKLPWRVTGKPSWITVSPDSGEATPSLKRIAVTASPAGLSPGTYGGTITFHSSGGIGMVRVLFSVGEHPSASVSVTQLHFAAGENDKSFTLSNQGTGMLFWSLVSSQPWLAVFPPSGVVYQGQSATIYATADRGALPVGTASAQLTISSNSEGGAIEIPVTMEVPAAPELRTSPDSLRYDYFVNASFFKVWNSGNAPLTWTASGAPSYVQLSSSGGSLDPGDTTTVDVALDRSGLGTGTYTAGIDVSAAGLPTRRVGVTVRHFNETKWMLDYVINDAEFDRLNNRIVAVGSTVVAPIQSKLLVFDPEARTVQSVTLPLTSTCVSVRPDGLFAAAGHDGSVSYVNLGTMTVQQTFGITADALDVVLAANGFAYVFPRRDQWSAIHCLNLATGVETLHSGRSIYAGTVGKLHPSGDYIYGANNGLSPSDFEKYDIRSGTAVYMYDSPYHGDYAFSGDVWISDDGLRLYARSRNVFRSSTVQAEDMTYNGNLSGTGALRWVEHSTAAGRVYALPMGDFFNPPAPEMRVYNTSFLALLGAVSLPPFLIPNGTGGGTLVPSSGEFVFANAAGSRVYIVVKVRPGTGTLSGWAITNLDTSAMP